MKTTSFITDQPSLGQTQSPALLTSTIPNPLPQLISVGTDPKEHIRHILLGSPEAIRQTIHLLHTLHYVETILWSPALTIKEPLIITPAQGEAMSLLRKPL